jgi:hypothetical protein
MATEGIDREAPTGFFGSMTDSVMGLMNPFDTDNLAKSFTTEAKPDTTNGPQRPKPSDIHVVYSIYGIVSEHTPEEWEVIREHQTKGRTWEEWMMGGERKRMDAAGFKTSFRKLEEDVPPAKVVPTPTVPSPPPVVPALSNPILTPLDANSELMVSRDDSGLGIFDSIIGMIGGTKGDFVDESFNFTYGVGDNMSLGLGWWLRSTFFHDQADYGGSSYYIGSWVGFAGDLLMGVGAFKALGKTFGREALESGLRNAPIKTVEGAIGFAPGYAQGIANKGLRKSFSKAMYSVGAKVKFVTEGDSYFNPRTMTAVINKKTATPGTLLDEFTHAFNRMHGKGRYLSDELAEVHRALANRVKVLGSTDRLGLADNTLYHQLELLNFLNSGMKKPGFIRVIPQKEISRFLSPLEMNGLIGGFVR